MNHGLYKRVTLHKNQTSAPQYQPPRCNCLALKVACKPRSLRETLFEFVFRARGTLTRRVPRDGVSVELTVGSPSPREGGTGDTSSGELTLAFTHSWNWDNEDSRWFQS